MGIQAVAHPQQSVHLVAGVQPGDQLVDLLHEVDLRRGVGALAHLHALHDGAHRHGVMAADKVLHLGQHNGQIAHILNFHLARQHIGQLQGLVFCNLNFSHGIVHLFL